MAHLAQLVWIHQQYAPKDAIPDIFGDPFLVSQNRLFRNTRKGVLDKGYRFIAGGSPLAKYYEAAPLLMLGELLSERTLPYRSTLPPVQQLLSRTPTIEIEDHVLLSLATKNVVFHESLHGFGSHYIDSELDEAGITDPGQRFVIASALVESFANTVERLAFHEAIEPMHRLFLLMNTYVTYSAETCKLLNDIVSHFGPRSAFRMGMGVLCLLNLRRTDPSAADLATIADSAAVPQSLTKAERRLLTESANFLWGLPREFRDGTSRFFYRMHSHEKEYLDISGQPSFAPPCTAEMISHWADTMFDHVWESQTEGADSI
ncbi:hypothetical protein AB4Y89_08145 [Terriglobus sp. 2YAB30_2]|uniref:hypothetical protein n=1 Tax=unclassified Terriglobus TaxID=2628988 RepID=UPI003F9BF78D